MCGRMRLELMVGYEHVRREFVGRRIHHVAQTDSKLALSSKNVGLVIQTFARLCCCGDCVRSVGSSWLAKDCLLGHARGWALSRKGRAWASVDSSTYGRHSTTCHPRSTIRFQITIPKRGDQPPHGHPCAAIPAHRGAGTRFYRPRSSCLHLSHLQTGCCILFD